MICDLFNQPLIGGYLGVSCCCNKTSRKIHVPALFHTCVSLGNRFSEVEFLSQIVFSWLHLWHMEVLGLRFELELLLLAYTSATATGNTGWKLPLGPMLSHICHLHHSLWQYWILNPLSEAWH